MLSKIPNNFLYEKRIVILPDGSETSQQIDKKISKVINDFQEGDPKDMILYISNETSCKKKFEDLKKEWKTNCPNLQFEIPKHSNLTMKTSNKLEVILIPHGELILFSMKENVPRIKLILIEGELSTEILQVNEIKKGKNINL